MIKNYEYKYSIKKLDEMSRLYLYSIKVEKIKNKPVGFSIKPNEPRANIKHINHHIIRNVEED